MEFPVNNIVNFPEKWFPGSTEKLFAQSKSSNRVNEGFGKLEAGQTGNCVPYNSFGWWLLKLSLWIIDLVWLGFQLYLFLISTSLLLHLCHSEVCLSPAHFMQDGMSSELWVQWVDAYLDMVWWKDCASSITQLWSTLWHSVDVLTSLYWVMRKVLRRSKVEKKDSNPGSSSEVTLH